MIKAVQHRGFASRGSMVFRASIYRFGVAEVGTIAAMIGVFGYWWRAKERGAEPKGTSPNLTQGTGMLGASPKRDKLEHLVALRNKGIIT